MLRDEKRTWKKSQMFLSQNFTLNKSFFGKSICCLRKSFTWRFCIYSISRTVKQFNPMYMISLYNCVLLVMALILYLNLREASAVRPKVLSFFNLIGLINIIHFVHFLWVIYHFFSFFFFFFYKKYFHFLSF